MTTMLSAPVLESPGWIFNEFESELIGHVNWGCDDGERETWKQAACTVIERHLRAYWAERGATVLVLEERIFRSITDASDVGMSFEHSFHIPGAEQALGTWEEIVAGIDYHEIENEL